jgi:FkbM family methyltransferase
VAVCHVDGETIKIGLSSEIEHYRADTYATKEPETIAWLRQNLREHDVFYDIGANIGLYAIFAAKIRPTCRVYAFEPEAQNFSRLCANILLNGLDNITPCSFPLSERDAFEVFHVHDSQPGSARHGLGASGCWREDSEPVVLRQGGVSVTLNTLVGKYGVPQPSLVKLDVDGLEENILDAGNQVLVSRALRSVLVEVMFKDGESSPWAVRKLATFGFVLQQRSDWVGRMHDLRSQNYIFVRP